MAEKAKERFFLKLETTRASRAKFEALYTARGLPQIEATTRLVEWFMDQDETVQQAIFRQLPSRYWPEARRLLIEGIVPIPLAEDATPQGEASTSNGLDEVSAERMENVRSHVAKAVAESRAQHPKAPAAPPPQDDRRRRKLG